jgi:hypothetical protein
MHLVFFDKLWLERPGAITQSLKLKATEEGLNSLAHRAILAIGPTPDEYKKTFSI